MTYIMEARRKGFEEFYLTQDVEAAAHLNFIRDDGEYGYHITRMAWYCWNAALDSVCVELPDKKEGIGVGKGYLAIDFENGYNHAIARCEIAIERAGLKVKP